MSFYQAPNHNLVYKYTCSFLLCWYTVVCTVHTHHTHWYLKNAICTLMPCTCFWNKISLHARRRRVETPISRVFKFSRCPAQVTGYFKHLCRVLFVFQILFNYTILFHQVIVIWSFWGSINKRTLMKIIIKQCGYYMYLLIFKVRVFLAGKSARVIWTCMYQRSSRFVLMWKFQHQVEAANDVVFPFNCREVSKGNK